MIYLNVDVIMDCPKKAVHNLLTITANIQGGVP